MRLVANALVVSCVVAVIQELRAKPLMQGRDQPWVVGGIGQLRAIPKSCVFNRDPGRPCFEVVEARHLLAVQARRIGEIAGTKLHGLTLQVLLNECDLRGVAGVFRDDLLHATGLGHSKDMRCFIQVEGHNVRAHLVDTRLPAGCSQGEPAGYRQHTEGCKDRNTGAERGYNDTRTQNLGKANVTAGHPMPPLADVEPQESPDVGSLEWRRAGAQTSLAVPQLIARRPGGLLWSAAAL